MVEENQIPWNKVEASPDSEIKLQGRLILAFKSELEASREELARMASTLARVQDERRKLLTGLEAERFRTVELEQKMASLEQAYKDRESRLIAVEADAVNRVKALQDQVHDLQVNEQKIQAERDAAETALATVEAALGERESALAILKGELDAIQGRTMQLENERGTVNAHALADCARYEQEIRALQSQRDDLKAKLDRIERERRFGIPENMVDDFATVRACMACREFTLMNEGDIKSVRAVKLFDNMHRMHMVGTLTFGEVKGKFTPKTKDLLDRIK